jgi:hypothetical protein
MRSCTTNALFFYRRKALLMSLMKWLKHLNHACAPLRIHSSGKLCLCEDVLDMIGTYCCQRWAHKFSLSLETLLQRRVMTFTYRDGRHLALLRSMCEHPRG